MIDYTLPEYDDVRNWIDKARLKNIDWSEILFARKKDDAGLQQFLSDRIEADFWPDITVEDWKAIVELQKKAEEGFIPFDDEGTIIGDGGGVNGTSIPRDKASSWQLYKAKLINDGFKPETIDSIEKASFRTLKYLSSDTTLTGPIKGLIIGNVQSGKTANMAALMAMAADWGWNLFIVLSGTIENLRMQTQKRLFNDLNQQLGNLFWHPLEHLSKGVDMAQKAQNLHFDDGAKQRYFTVCLKNPSRLRDLIQWLQVDKNKQRQMKILVIDDEADQAGVNTKHTEDEEERTKINFLIQSLVNGKNEKGSDTEVKYKAMNYIGYTATPYANVLNEAGENSLYPRNFISTLAVSKEYFGPQQIFGYHGDSAEFDGMDIVRVISKDELENLMAIHDGDTSIIPDSLIEAIIWFLCGVSCMRIWGYKKPISMLVHTSQKTAHHQMIAQTIEQSFTKMSRDVDELLIKAKQIYLRETYRLSIEEFRKEYPSYDRSDEEINDYPDFSEIEREIKTILGTPISNIKLDEEGDLTYHKGVHLCVDNCLNNGVTDDGMYVRLAYPEPEKMPSPAPAFIVVGGATLSRGLTIEGLISTFFIRSVGQADTLMQMGRWFGYRKNYELLPRIWMTEKTREQFVFLAALDQELRDEILSMEVNGRIPSEYGPKVKNSPKLSFIRITAKNKMHSASEADMDYSGATNQTNLFDNDVDKLRHNVLLTEEFLAKIGDEWTPKVKYKNHKRAAIWRGVSFSLINEYLRNFSFQERLRVFNDVNPLLSWIDKMTKDGKLGDWNVVVTGRPDSQNGEWVLPNGRIIYKVRRARKKVENEIEDRVINILKLKEGRDVLADVDVDGLTDLKLKNEIIEYIESGENRAAEAVRDMAGLETTPQLLIYRVDKDSKSLNSELRQNLDSPEDLIGICIHIPGGRVGTNYASSVAIKMNPVFDGEGDLEGTDED